MNEENKAMAGACAGFAKVAEAAQLDAASLTAELKKRRRMARPMYLLALAVVGFTGLIDALVKIFGGAQ